MYKYIFFTNVLRILDERRMTKSDLADASDISNSFITDLTSGKGNPSLKVMEAIAAALEVPLPYLLEDSDWDQEELKALTARKVHTTLPPGYERVTVVLPEHRAFVVKRWGDETRKKLKDVNATDC